MIDISNTQKSERVCREGLTVSVQFAEFALLPGVPFVKDGDQPPAETALLPLLLYSYSNFTVILFYPAWLAGTPGPPCLPGTLQRGRGCLAPCSCWLLPPSTASRISRRRGDRCYQTRSERLLSFNDASAHDAESLFKSRASNELSVFGHGPSISTI